jgi:hypothetical protein
MGAEKQGIVVGELKATGLRPKFIPRLEAAGFNLPVETFGAEPLPAMRRR